MQSNQNSGTRIIGKISKDIQRGNQKSSHHLYIEISLKSSTTNTKTAQSNVVAVKQNHVKISGVANNNEDGN